MEEDKYYTSICSAATLQSNKKGFFQSYADNVIEVAGTQWLDEFQKLSSDSSRLLKCYNDEKLYEAVHGVLQNVQHLYRSKAASLSRLRRLEGEKVESTGKSDRALLLLTQAIIRAPAPGVDNSVDDGLSLPLALRCRAQILWKLSEYQLCLGDLQTCLKEKLPEQFRVEAYWCMAKCYQKLGQVARARVALQVTLKLLGPGDTNWRSKIDAELAELALLKEKEPEVEKDEDSIDEDVTDNIMNLTNDISAPSQGVVDLNNEISDVTNEVTDSKKDTDEITDLTDDDLSAIPREFWVKKELLNGAHSQQAGLSSAVAVRSGETTGRYIVARQPINSGDVLAIEQPHVACLLPDKFGTHCHHCFARLRTGVGCADCAGLAFCSAVCRDAAHSYHQFECRYMDLLIGSGMSILCHTALRTVTQQKYSYWKRVYNKQPVSPDFNRLSLLVTHADKRQPRDFVSRTLMALFLLRILEHSKYIPSSDYNEDELSGMRLFLGTVLLHLLQCLQFNAHEIYETVYKTEMDFTSSKINYIAVGIYPSVALFNHDCYPAIARYFRGKELVIRALRPLGPGDTVAENYGPVYTLRSLAERQRSLASRYWFTCNCTTCQEDWCKLAELDENILQIRCKTKDCIGFITTSREPKKPKTKCPKCGANINVSEAVILVKSYDADYSRAMELMGEGLLTEAAKLLSVYSDAMHIVCRPPLKNLSLAHEAMRSCWAYYHNKHVIK